MQHPLPYSLNCATLLVDRPLRERPAEAARLGFDWIELWWPFDQAVPSAAQVDEFVHIVQDAGVQVSCLSLANTDRVDGVDRDLGLDGPLSVLVDNAAVGADLGSRLGCRMYNRRWAMRRDGVDPLSQDELSVQAFGAAGAAVAPYGATLLLEAVSNVQTYPVQRATDVYALLARVRAATGATNTGLMADLYQLAIGVDDVDDEIATNADRFTYVQIADSPGRGRPGSGNLPLERWLTALADRGYEGVVGLEYWANDDPDPFAWVPEKQRGDRRIRHA